MAQIKCISAGSIVPLLTRGGADGDITYSAINKRPISSLSNPIPIRVTRLGIEGDQQADQRVHGGPDKAVYAYPIEHYAFWKELLEDATGNTPQHEYGQMGENISTIGFNEREVWVGDLWKIGTVVFQVVKHREPCFKFNIRMGFRGAAKAMIQSAKCGWYLSVLKEGIIHAGQEIEVEPGPRKTTIHELNQKQLNNHQSELF